MSDVDQAALVTEHYGRPDLGRIILDALQAAGKNVDALTPADLAPVDEFHIRGKEATRELARLATATARASAPPALGPHLLLGPLAGPALRNTLRNLEEQR